MSKQVVIDYQQIGARCEGICEVAEAQLTELDKMLASVKESSGSIMTEQAEALARAIERERTELLRKIKAVREKVEEEAKRGVIKVYEEDERALHMLDTVHAAEALQSDVDVLASQRMMEFQSFLTALLGQSINEAYRKMRERAGGVISIDDATQRLLDTIDDDILRQFTQLAYLKDNMLSGAGLLEAGKQLMEKSLNATYESRYAEEAAKIRAELEASKADTAAVDKLISDTNGGARERLTAVRQAATREIVGEKVRQKSLRIIMKAITARGFIVDKKNIRINRDTNEVIMVALKASGEKAEFRVFLDGKFIYDFHGYEGQACQKDIEPFMQDLEEVYGMHITKQTEVWSNPDKNSTMKYQSINTNKNKK